ncbi:ion transporter [Gilvimarinus polysaccharolyticus]|uniref:ion transporter n=1 Tax=Gilvimarinus polysaccharolyticus TaxID=863921 RepID=UPI0006734BA7|nr:ion transporter [Gilvimarinus polysaccharolyticus]
MSELIPVGVPAAGDSWQARFNRLRSNKAFELFVVAIIVFSALVIGAKTYDIPPLASKIIVALDWAITLFFLLEVSVRFWGEPRKRDFFKSGWNIFDTVIVVVSLIPIDNSDMALVGRLIRVFRVLRMVSIIPELRILLSSLLKALPQLGYVALLMFIIFYIYGAVGSLFFSAINEVLWGDIAISMLTLFRVMTFEDWTDVMYETMEVYPLSWMFYVSFIFLTAFAFLNMIIGIVVNVIEKENQARLIEEEGVQPARSDLESQLTQLQKSVDLLLKQQNTEQKNTNHQN